MLQRIFLLMLAPQFVFGQIRDNFSSTSLSGIWIGDRSLFTTSNGYLTSNGTTTTGSNIYLSTSVPGLNNMEWQFLVNLKFAPSSSNYFRFYLNASSSTLNSSSTNGYYIQIGETNQDTIKIYKQVGASRTRLLASSFVCYSSATANYANVRIKVQRDDTGLWSLFSDCAGGQNFTPIGSIFDNTFTIAGFSGPNCIYGTPSRYNLFQFDDISVLPLGFDDTPPELISGTVLNSNTLSLEFSEALEKVSAESINNYMWEEGQTEPNVATLSISGSTVWLHFSKSFPSYIPHQIQVSGIKDLQGNTLPSTVYSFIYQPPITLVQENFTDGDYTNNPIWTGTSNMWEIRNQLLHSISTTPNSSFYLSTPFTKSGATEWEIYAHLEFNPSSLNFIDFVLQSDNNLLITNFQNGYFVRMGGSTDEVSLYKKVNGVNQLVVNGRDNILNNSNNELKVKVRRDSLFNWTLLSDISGTGDNYLQEGMVKDSTFKNGKSLGLIVQQSTSSFFSKHSFGPIYAGPIRKDTIPPSIHSIDAIDERNLEIHFSEKIDTNQAKNLGAIILNGSLSPEKISITDSKSIAIKFRNSFINGNINTLTIIGIKDISGNQTDWSGTFIYTKPYQINYREISINELYADESPSNGLPDGEYMELYNSLPNPINLQGFSLIDGSAKRTFNRPLTISGNGFVVICNSPATAELFHQFDPSISVYTLSGFSLTNSGETQELLNPQGVSIDKVTYSTSWYKSSEKSSGGWSLEQINPYASCSNSSNWNSSNHTLGGTPGKMNSIFSKEADRTKPKIVSLKEIAPLKWMVEFSEPVDSNSVQKSAFSISNGVSVASIDSISKDLISVILEFNQPIIQGKSYTIQPVGINDCPGNTADTTKYGFGKGRKPMAYELLITELMADETPKLGLPEYEFVEIFNPTQEILSLDSLKICDLSNCTYLPNNIVSPGKYIILTGSTYSPNFESFGKTIGLANFPSLNNSGDRITIKNNSNLTIHTVNYTDEWYVDEGKKQGGWSLEMIDPANPCGSQSNWKASINPQGGTPGKMNSNWGANPDNLAPDIISTVLLDSLTLQIQTNEVLDSSSFTTSMSYISNQKISLTWKLIPPDFDKIKITLSQPTELNTIETITLTGIKDCIGNSKTLTGNFVRPTMSKTGDLVLNEVLFNPYTGGADFVEIYNRSPNYIDLYGWQLANLANDSVSNSKPVTPNHVIFPPYGYLVLTTDTQNIKNNYPKSKSGALIQMPTMPSYNDDEGTVVLVMPSGRVAEQFSYSKDMHFKLLDDVEGVSLERISPELPASYSSSWHSAASNVGYATPGYINSQLTNIYQSTDPFTLTNESFTPDGDGDRDYILLNYKFSTPGQVANINVFDTKGRKVKTLAKSELLAVDGTYQWDGTDDSGTKASIGIYLIHVEVFDLQGKSGIYIKKVALGGKF